MDRSNASWGRFLVLLGIATALRSGNMDAQALEGGHKEVLKTEGDIIIGGLFPVHRRGKTTENMCGDLDPHPGYQYLASMLFALEEINNDTELLPNITLGTEIYDTCRSQTIGADGAKEIIRYTLKATNTTPPLAGVVGPFRSDVSVAVANLLRVFNIPQVSYGSTTTELSNKQIYDYFLRTVPPNSFQSKAMVDVVKHFGWTYVMTVFSPGQYGEKGMEIFYEEAQKANLCIANKIKLPSFPKDEDFREAVRKLEDTRKANKDGELGVVVLFCIQRDNEGLVRASQLEKLEFAWVASNSWGDRRSVTEGYEEAGRGAITMNYIEGKVERFRQHLLSRNINNSKGVWFEEFWQTVLKCRLNNSAKPLNFPRQCDPGEKLPSNLEIAPVRVVMNAVYAMAHALNDMHTAMCSGSNGKLCARMKEMNRDEFLEYLKNASFPDVSLNFTVRFNRNGEVDGNYSILNFQKAGPEYHHVKVGAWGGVLQVDDSIDGDLSLEGDLKWYGGESRAPKAYCSKPCAAKQIKVPQLTNPRCCWRCSTCKPSEIALNNSCHKCPQGFRPDASLLKCEKLPVVYPTWSDIPAIVISALAGVATLGTFSTVAFFVVKRNHRVIKAAGRELCAILFAGVLLCYVAALLYVAKPSVASCTARRFIGSVSMTMCYAPVLLRTIRIYRIFKAAQGSVARPSFVSPQSQVLVAFGITAVQILIVIVWIFSDSPAVQENYQYEERTIFECRSKDTHVAINLCYNILLMLISTVYAFKTRNFPRNFNEAKYIGITMYLSCSVWVVFLPCYLNADDSIWESYFASYALLFIGTITLLGLLVPKVFLVLFDNSVRPCETLNTADIVGGRSSSPSRR